MAHGCLVCYQFIDMNLLIGKGTRMNFNQGKLAEGLVDEVLQIIHNYDDTLYMATVIGCLELVKQHLINDAMEEDND